MRLNTTTTGFKTLFSSTLVFLLAATSVTAQEKVTFDDHVQPILRQKCFSCHNQNKKSSGLDLTTYTNLMLGGSSGDVLEPGSPDDSYLFLLITHESEPFMPPKSPKMPDTDRDLGICCVCTKRFHFFCKSNANMDQRKTFSKKSFI